MDWGYLLNSFEGRIGRQAFWVAMIAVGAANVLACFVAQAISGDRLSAIVDLAFTYPEFAIAAKRSHDRNLPLWLLAVFFIANGVLDFLTVVGLGGTNEAPSTLSVVIAVPFTVFGIALLVELGFRRGTKGPNPYGPDPVAKR